MNRETQLWGIEIIKTKDVETFLSHREEWEWGAPSTSPLHISYVSAWICSGKGKKEKKIIHANVWGFLKISFIYF